MERRCSFRRAQIDVGPVPPRRWTDEMVRTADVVVSMGCGDACPVVPGKRYEDWVLDDPAGQGLDVVRRVRDEIGDRVRALLVELGIPVPPDCGAMAGAGRPEPGEGLS